VASNICNIWPYGAVYSGEWWNDAMHGVGNFTAADGTHYRGSWNAGVKQGLGRQLFAGGDSYEAVGLLRASTQTWNLLLLLLYKSAYQFSAQDIYYWDTASLFSTCIDTKH